jgi:A/G-specific adenine glycosylase
MTNRPALDSSLTAAWRRSLSSKLLAWFRQAARDLPWRRTRDLYAIWISEIMLQQTQVATVVDYWKRFMARFPSARALAEADEHEVLRLWEGLGYYRRARQLHAAARKIADLHDGQFPSDFAAVRALPGIGRYTAGAILSIGLDQRLPILEANTIRVLSRLTGYQGDVHSAAGQRYLWSVAESILPRQHCGTFNQSLMELGSEICTPRAAACDRCPVMLLCEAHRKSLVEKIPLPAGQKKYEDVTEVAVIIRRGDRVVLRQCQPGERWAGLWDFPRFAAVEPIINGELDRQLVSQTRGLVGLQVKVRRHLATLKHGVTRFRITLHCYEAKLYSPSRQTAKLDIDSSARWVRTDALDEYALNTTGRKISRLLAKS